MYAQIEKPKVNKSRATTNDIKHNKIGRSKCLVFCITGLKLLLSVAALSG